MSLASRPLGNGRSTLAPTYGPELPWSAGSSTQVLIKNHIRWDNLALQTPADPADDLDVRYGTPLCRYALVSDSEGGCHFVWVMHHAVFDGWTVRIILNFLHREYYQSSTDSLSIQPYSSLIKYTQALDKERCQRILAKSASRGKESNLSSSPGPGIHRRGSNTATSSQRYPSQRLWTPRSPRPQFCVLPGPLFSGDTATLTTLASVQVFPAARRPCPG